LLPCARASKDLEVFFIDAEGGQATLVVAPGGESLLIDAGHAGYSGRDPDRVKDAAKAGKVKKIDDLLITDYDQGDFGGVAGLSERIRIENILDRGPVGELDKRTKVVGQAYQRVLATTQHKIVQPGDAIPLKDVDVRIVASAGRRIDRPLAGAGQPNPACAGVQPKSGEEGAGSQSIGLVLSFGDFRMVDLAGLSWNQELGLVCPNNLLGKATVYLTDGLDRTNPPPLIAALAPRVVVMNNGARIGAEAAAWRLIRNTRSVQDIWQLHFAIDNGDAANSLDPFNANLYEHGEGKPLDLVVHPDGSFTITNKRNKFSRAYGR
jgi:competence protein ComEC